MFDTCIHVVLQDQYVSSRYLLGGGMVCKVARNLVRRKKKNPKTEINSCVDAL